MGATNVAKKLPSPSRVLDAALAFVLPIAFGVALVSLWEAGIIHRILGVKTLQLPLPSRILAVFCENAGKIFPDAATTLSTALGGLMVGSALGFLVAVTATFFPRWGYGGLTVLSAFNAIPIVALSPITNVWFASPALAKGAVVSLVCMVAMAVSAYRGLNDVKPFSIDLMQSYAAGKRTTFLKLRLPNSLPYVFTGIRVNVASAMIGTIVSEYFSSASKGLGYGIRNKLSTGQFPLGWAYIVGASIVGIALYLAVSGLEAAATSEKKA
jgi:NitT/TauT family transport system permease protein